MLRSIGTAAVIAALGLGAMTAAPAPADARVFVGVGVGFPGYYAAPYPYYPYAYYPPPPPPAYYYPPPAYYPPSGEPPPGAGMPGAAGPTASAEPSGGITYTARPGWTNAQGQPCREYKTTQMVGGRATEVFGTACRDPSGQWRVAE